MIIKMYKIKNDVCVLIKNSNNYIFVIKNVIELSDGKEYKNYYIITEKSKG